MQRQLDLFSPEKGGLYSDLGFGHNPAHHGRAGSMLENAEKKGKDNRKDRDGADGKSMKSKDAAAANKGRAGTKTVYDGVLEYVSSTHLQRDSSKTSSGRAVNEFQLPDELPMPPDRRNGDISPKGLGKVTGAPQGLASMGFNLGGDDAGANILNLLMTGGAEGEDGGEGAKEGGEAARASGEAGEGNISSSMLA